MIRILIADDHAMFRDGLRRILMMDPRMEVVAEAANGNEVMLRARESKPDVVLLDVTMPGRGGLEGLEELKRGDPNIKVLMLTAHPEDHYALRCLKAGADGYMTKDQAADALVDAILRIHRAGKYISPAMAEHLVLHIGGDAEAPPHAALSDREFQVLCLLGAGKTVSAIAAELCLSVKTVSTYRSRMLVKMNLTTTSDLIRYALQEGLAT